MAIFEESLSHTIDYESVESLTQIIDIDGHTINYSQLLEDGILGKITHTINYQQVEFPYFYVDIDDHTIDYGQETSVAREKLVTHTLNYESIVATEVIRLITHTLNYESIVQVSVGVDAESTINYEDDALGHVQVIYEDDGEHTLNYESVVDAGKSQPTDDGVINYTQNLTAIIVYTADVEHTFDYDQNVTSEIPITVEHTINYNQSYDTNYEYLDHTFNYSQTVSTTSVLNITVEHTLNYQSLGKRAFEVEAEHTFNYAIEVARLESVTHTFNYGDSATYEIVRPLTHTINYGQTVFVIGDLNLTQSNTINYNQKVVAYVTLSTNLFNPAVDDGSCLNTSLTLGTRDTVYFESGADNVTLRNPEFGNDYNFSMFTADNIDRSGRLRRGRNTIWPVDEIFSFSCIALTRADVDSYVEFLAKYIGQEVTFIDYENRSWLGVITSYSDPIIDEGECNYSINIAFEGTLV